jgi:hypothetical protein
MGSIGIWKRRLSADSDDFEFGIGDFPQRYKSEKEARDAMDALVSETNRFPSADPSRAHKRLVEAGHPLFRRVR